MNIMIVLKDENNYIHFHNKLRLKIKMDFQHNTSANYIDINYVGDIK